MQKPIFITHHQSTCVGEIGFLAQRYLSGYEVLFSPGLRHLPNPNTLRSPIVIFGGQMSVNDDLHFLKREIAWVKKLIDNNHPIFGICLGAQIIAKALSQSITRCPRQTVECGYHKIYHTKNKTTDLDFRKIFLSYKNDFSLPQKDVKDNNMFSIPNPEFVYQWHEEGISWVNPPEELIEHSYSSWNDHTSQYFSIGKSIGVQFHPEITTSRIKGWIDTGKDFIKRPGSKCIDEHIIDHQNHAPQVQAWLRQTLLNQWSMA